MVLSSDWNYSQYRDQHTQQQMGMTQQAALDGIGRGLSGARDGGLSIKIERKKTFIEELQAETDEWLKDIDI